jgi:ketosteroid isomerase-like protein
MSQENVEIARALLEAWDAGDTDAARALYHPDIVVLTAEGWPEPGPWVGRDAVMRSLEQILDTWDAGAFEPISFIDAGDRVVVRQLWHGVGRGPDLNLEFTTVATHRKGKVVLLEFFWDHAEALEAVGLSDQGTPQENVDVVRRWLAAMSGSPEEIRAAIDEFWDADADYYPVRKFPEARPCHGLEEVARFFSSQFEDAFSRWNWEVSSVIAAGDDRVLASTNLRAQGRGSGIDLEGDLYYCYWLRHGRFFRVEDHLTVRGALGAFGLEGETLESAGLSA